jgi:hypothetical protein
MANCSGTVDIIINGKTNHAEGAQLNCDGDCTKGECKERQGKIWYEPDPADARQQMLISETWCSCDEHEPEGCHIVLQKNLTKHTSRVICRGGGCDKGKECQPIKVDEKTDHVYQPKKGEHGSGFDVDDNFFILVRLTYACQCL